MEYICHTINDTQKCAEEIVRLLKDTKKPTATVLALSGVLGSGKTELTKHIARALGVQYTITSPTFVLRNDYPTADDTFKTLHHIDAYRITDGDKNDTMGIAPILADQAALIVIEWSENILESLPPETVNVTASISGAAHTYTSDDL